MQVSDRRASAKHVSGATVAKRMRRNGPVDIRRAAVLANDLPDGVRPHPLAEAVQKQVPIPVGPKPIGPHAGDVAVEQRANVRADRDGSIFPVLAFTYDQEAVPGIDVVELNVCELGPSDRAGVQHFEDDPVTIAGGRVQVRLSQDLLHFGLVENGFG